MYKDRPCPCGSGEPRCTLVDAAGIFLCYACEACEPAKLAAFDPAIFDPESAYAITGDEEDIGRKQWGVIGD